MHLRESLEDFQQRVQRGGGRCPDCGVKPGLRPRCDQRGYDDGKDWFITWGCYCGGYGNLAGFENRFVTKEEAASYLEQHREQIENQLNYVDIPKYPTHEACEW